MVKTEIKTKKAKRRRKFVKDKAIVNFLLEHLKPIKIDFSKIKIPSFLEFEKDERSKGETKILDGSPNNSKISIFELSLLNDLLENDKK